MKLDGRKLLTAGVVLLAIFAWTVMAFAQAGQPDRSVTGPSRDADLRPWQGAATPPVTGQDPQTIPPAPGTAPITIPGEVSPPAPDVSGQDLRPEEGVTPPPAAVPGQDPRTVAPAPGTAPITIPGAVTPPSPEVSGEDLRPYQGTTPPPAPGSSAPPPQQQMAPGTVDVTPAEPPTVIIVPGTTDVTPGGAQPSALPPGSTDLVPQAGGSDSDSLDDEGADVIIITPVPAAPDASSGGSLPAPAYPRVQ